MNFKRLTDMARKTVDARGGTEGLKQDAERLKGIAKGPGSAKDKARKAADALKQPSTEGGGTTPADSSRPPA